MRLRELLAIVCFMLGGLWIALGTFVGGKRFSSEFWTKAIDEINSGG